MRLGAGLFGAVFALGFAEIAAAQDHGALVDRAIEGHVLPGYARLSAETAALSASAEAYCGGEAAFEAVETAYHAAFDAWMGVSHLRFGPSEADDRAFAIAFWPDSRGTTPRTLAALIASEDPVVDDPAGFSEVSIAARGLFALDALLFDPVSGGASAPGSYPCRLLTAIAGDVAFGAAAIERDWAAGYADLMRAPGPRNPVYASAAEASAELFGALSAGLEATADLRLGRPLGSFDRPRPRRAEAWRSGRPQRNAVLSLAALAQLAERAFLPELSPEDAQDVRDAFDRALEVAARFEPPMTEAVADPARRIGVEAARAAVRSVQAAAAEKIGGALGLSAGFNALDGD
ncbi:MAG: imelysin family protein [Pseudomonadota bacterium]